MLMQRQYNGAGKCTHVLVKHSGTEPEQNFSRRLVLQAVTDGWMKIDGAPGSQTLTIKAEPEDLFYAVKRQPGYYCISTGERIPVDDLAWSQMLQTGVGDLSRQQALAWLASKGKAATDYEVTMAYECVLGAAQHEKFRAVAAVSGNLVAAYMQEG